MLKRPVKYLVLSDIHLGHKRNTTAEIVENLKRFFARYTHDDDLDIVFLAGDVFDRLLDFTTDDMTESMMWISELMLFCSRKQVKLRVLEGTPSHDWMQSRIFDTIKSIKHIDLDFKYVSTLSIEHIEDLGMTVLYMPDEWNISTDKTHEQVLELLVQHNLDKVDIGIFHGMFAYQAPPVAAKIPKHDESRYLSIVRYFINIGHVHTFSTYDRILAQGSFDRLCHGEEEPKGGIEVVIDPNGDNRFTFIENKSAKVFKTLIVKGKDVETAIKQIESVIKPFPRGSYLRLKASKDHPAIIAFDELRKRFIDVVLTKLTTEEEQEILELQNSDSLIAEAAPYQAITITPDNIEMLLAAEITARHNFSESQWDIFRHALKAVCT